MEEKKITILEKIEAISKNSSKFLILKTNPNKIYVFPDYVPEKEWSKLVAKGTYYMNIKTNARGNKSLKGFKTITSLFKDERSEINIIE